jgi:pimeloyl-ACP methyl ester carboxylesterase
VLLTPEGLSRADEATLDERVRRPIAALQAEPTADNARRAVLALCSRGMTLPDAAIAEMGRALAEIDEPMRLGPPFTASELAGFTAPVLIIAAGEDVLFPGTAAAARARAVLPGPREAIVVPDANHVDLRFFFGPLIEEARAFLAG